MKLKLTGVQLMASYYLFLGKTPIAFLPIAMTAIGCLSFVVVHQKVSVTVLGETRSGWCCPIHVPTRHHHHRRVWSVGRPPATLLVVIELLIDRPVAPPSRASSVIIT